MAVGHPGATCRISARFGSWQPGWGDFWLRRNPPEVHCNIHVVGLLFLRLRLFIQALFSDFFSIGASHIQLFPPIITY